MSVGKALRAVANSVGFVVLLAMGLSLLGSNLWLAIFFILAALDQFEDVYYLVTRKRLVPRWLMPVDIVFECVLLIVSLGILLTCAFYSLYFSTWFFRLAMTMSVLVAYSSIEDIVEWRRVTRYEAVREAERQFVVRRA